MAERETVESTHTQTVVCVQHKPCQKDASPCVHDVTLHVWEGSVKA